MVAFGLRLWYRSAPKPGDSVRVPWSVRKSRELDERGLEFVMVLALLGLFLIAKGLAELFG